MANLQNIDNYDAFKGTLYLLVGNITESLLLRPNWNFIIQLWPVLIKANFSEKPKIARMFDHQFFPLISSYFITIPIQKNVLSTKFTDLFQDAELSSFAMPSLTDIAAIETAIKESNNTNQGLYLNLVENLLQTLEQHKL